MMMHGSSVTESVVDASGGMMDHGDHGHHHHRSLTSSSMDMSMGTVMYMDGLHWALFPPSGSAPPPCLNLFFPSWTLYSRTRFLFGMTSVTLLGILVEACGVWRARCLRRGRARRRRRGEDVVGVTAIATSLPPPTATRVVCANVPGSVRRFCLRRCDIIAALLHASRILLGYLLMLAVMSYAVEFLLPAVFGVVLGRYCFRDTEGSGGGVVVRGSNDDGGIGIQGGAPGVNGTWGGGDPCCDFDDNEDIHEPLISWLASSCVSRSIASPPSGGIS